ncbi:MAG: threonyl-tRNA synthetase [Chlamydiia bacterium]|nr:threonyl-tRNA synthetase [Chlamydiia bacterium]
MLIHYCDPKDKSKTTTIELADGAKATDLIEKFNLRAPHQGLAALINGKARDLSTPLHDNDTISFYSFDDAEGKEVFWHTSAHVLAQAILRKFPQAKPTIGPPIENGFYYDFADLTISESDLEAIEEEMQKICEENYKSERSVFASKQEALERFKDNRYKVELINSFDDSELTGYTQGEFFDLCRGPHLASLGKIKAVKILKTSGAYWRGDSKNAMLTRIYGISFPDRKLLKEYLHNLEEAKKRDHKVLGPKLDLFSFHEEAPGIPFIHPKGMIIWNRLIDYWRSCHMRAGYLEIKTPTILIKDLWERSGHWQNYHQNMFVTTQEDREFAIKPMNCPGAMLFFKEKNHSYRELPLRLAEIGHVHRFEPSGSLSGLFRVRSFHQDDAHVFLQLSDVQDEILRILKLLDEIYSTFGLTYELALSTRPDKQTIGSDEAWEITTNGLRSALEAHGKTFKINEGDGAFYGPKIDIYIHDAMGRAWQCGTIQLDMSLPERFELEYTAADGTRQRPILLHRALLGSFERFFGSLIEFYVGKFPLWLNPAQVRLVAVATRHVDYAREVQQAIASCGFIVDLDDSNESVSKKIREAQMLQYNYILTIGDQEVTNKTIALRTRDNVVHGEISVATFLEKIEDERNTKALKSPF